MADEKQVLVKFVTKLSEDYRVPETPVAVPAQLKRYGLSQIINTMLSLDPVRPFDFIIAGQLLRKPLEVHLMEHGLSAESLLEVEYVPAVVPPKHQHSAPHDDWVSCVDGSWGTTAVSGSYDGCVRVWSLAEGGEASCSSSWKAHAGGVNSVACVPAGQGSSSRMVASAGKDQAVFLWQVDEQGGQAQLLASFQGHTDAVESVAVSPNGTRMVSAGWDGNLFVWRCGQEVATAAAEAAAEGAAAAPPKKRKGGAAKGDTANGVAPEGGLKEEVQGTLSGHVHCVSSAAWASNGLVFSGGWDHSVRRWDVATGINTDTYNGSKVVTALACPPTELAAAASTAPPGTQGSLVAFGCSDRMVRVWDSRAKQGEALSLRGLAGHAGWVVGLAWCPTSAFHMASASHDHTVKLWDLRTPVALATLTTHTDKALCVDWVGKSTLVSGGADCQLHSHVLEQQL